MYNEESASFDPMEIINFSISADHRILDGATVAKFGSNLKKLVENPH
jgi:pyruvate/2-oxoglutarate dehydrogenase complex dihydrolipoamide acyltransferase (E2) component